MSWRASEQTRWREWLKAGGGAGLRRPIVRGRSGKAHLGLQTERGRVRCNTVLHAKHTTPCYSPTSFGHSGIGRESLAAAAHQERATARSAMGSVLSIVGRGDAADRPKVRRFPPFHQGLPASACNTIKHVKVINMPPLTNTLHRHHQPVYASHPPTTQLRILFTAPSHPLSLHCYSHRRATHYCKLTPCFRLPETLQVGCIDFGQVAS